MNGGGPHRRGVKELLRAAEALVPATPPRRRTLGCDEYVFMIKDEGKLEIPSSSKESGETAFGTALRAVAIDLVDASHLFLKTLKRMRHLGKH